MRNEKLKLCMVVEEEIAGPNAIIPGGIGQYTLRYCRRLAEMGHDVTIACYSSQGFELQDGFIRFVGIPNGSWSWGVQLYRWMKTQTFDVIEIPEWGGHGAIPALFLRRKNGRIVTRGHGHSLWVQRVHGKTAKRGRQHFLEWVQLHFSKGVLANSGFLKGLYLQDFGLKEEKVDICHIGIDRNAISQDGQVYAGDYQGPVMIYVGGYDRRKGPADLIHILHEVNKRMKGFSAKLIMVGQDTPTGPDGMSYKEYCVQTAVKLGVADQIDFMSATPRNQLAQFYGRASLLVSASRAETLGIPFLEAMSLGLPVITWKTGAAPELIRDGVTGYMLEYGDISGFADRVAAVFSNAALWHTLSDNAVKNVDQSFMEAKVLDQQVSWYQKISV